MLKYLIQCQELMKRDIQNDIKLVNVSVNLKKMFVIISKVGIKVKVDVNVKN